MSYTVRSCTDYSKGKNAVMGQGIGSKNQQLAEGSGSPRRTSSRNQRRTYAIPQGIPSHPASAALLAGTARTQSINLLAGTIDTQAICGLTLYDLTASLGRPSAVEAPNALVAKYIGPTVSYHQRGLKVLFQPGATGSEKVWSLSVYMSRTWDEDNLQTFEIFNDALEPPLSADWRIERTSATIAGAGYEAIDETPEYKQEEWKKLGIPGSANPSHDLHIHLMNGSDVVFVHEPVTRCLERAAFTCP
ncbi:MAG: hypothetical protein M9914_05960 [Trueperaceae bacterium]|nr:hypothetical protein [Trueperaceae bacterium]